MPKRSVINNRGGGGTTKQLGGQVRFYPYQKGGERVSAMLEGRGRHKELLGSFNIGA